MYLFIAKPNILLLTVLEREDLQAYFLKRYPLFNFII